MKTGFESCNVLKIFVIRIRILLTSIDGFLEIENMLFIIIIQYKLETSFSNFFYFVQRRI